MISTTCLRSHSSRMCRLMLGRFMTCCQVHHDPVLGFLSLPVPPATPPLPCLDPASPLPHHAPRGPYPVSNGGVHLPQLVPIPSSSTTVPQCVPIFDQFPDISMINGFNPMDMQGQAGPSRGSGEGSPLVPGTEAQTTTIPMRTVLRRTATRDSCPPKCEPVQQRVWPLCRSGATAAKRLHAKILPCALAGRERAPSTRRPLHRRRAHILRATRG